MSEQAFRDGVDTFAELVLREKLAAMLRSARRNHSDQGGRCVHVVVIPHEHLGVSWCHARAMVHGYVSIVEQHVPCIMTWTNSHPEVLAKLHTHLIAYHPTHELLFMFVCFPPEDETWVIFATLQATE